MQVKIKDIVLNVEAIKSLQEVKFPVKVSYKIKRLIDKLESPLKTYEEKRIELVKEYGDAQEDGNLQVKDPEKLREFATKITELQDVEEEIDFESISISELGDIEIPAKDLIDWIFTE